MTEFGARDIDAFLRQHAMRFAGCLPDGVEISVSVIGDGGGTWTILASDGAVRVWTGRARWSDCTLECDVDQFWAILDGQVEPYRAFQDRQLRIHGDVGLALAMQRAVLGAEEPALALGG